MFNQMLEGVKEETIGFLFRIEVQIEEAPKEVTGVGIAPKLLGKGLTPSAQRRQQQLLYSAPAVDGAAGRGEIRCSYRTRRRYWATAGPARAPAKLPAPPVHRVGRRLASAPAVGQVVVVRPVAQRALPVRIRQEVQALPRGAHDHLILAADLGCRSWRNAR